MNLVLSGGEPVFDGKPIDALIKVANELKINYVDLWIPKNSSCNSKSEIKEKLEENNIKVACITTWSHLCTEMSPEKEVDLLIESLEWAEYLKAPRVNTYFGRLNEKNDERAIRLYIKALSPVLALAKQKKIIICLENEFDSRKNDTFCSDISRSAEKVLLLMETVNSPYFKVTYDPTNFYLAQEEEYPFAFNILKEHIGYIHLKNGRKYLEKFDKSRKIWKDQEREYIFCSMDQGAVNFEKIITSCMEYNPSWFYAYEPHISYKEKEEKVQEILESKDNEIVKILGFEMYKDWRDGIHYIRKIMKSCSF